ncbi:MAG: hypothetical protein RR014_06190, partial [Bilophila sp.]
NWCGEWGTYGGWIAFLMACAVLWIATVRGVVPETPPMLVFIAGTLIPLCVSAILWTTIARSTNPMRRKISMAFALLLYVAAIASGGALIVVY